MHWSDLSNELDTWRGEGRIATLWWRDDDATAPGPALDRLAGIAREHAVTVGLAVIPALASGALATWIESARVEVLQHGWAHRNHATDGEKKSELGRHRAPEVVTAELAKGLAKLRGLAGAYGLTGACRLTEAHGLARARSLTGADGLARARHLPVLVPPWNRIDPALIPALPPVGFRGLSMFGSRPAAEPAPGLRQTNCHVDVVDWRGGRGFVGEDRAIAAVAGYLEARRTGSVDPAEPTGLMTHHLVHEESTWTFIARLMERTRHHPAARWLTPSEAILG